MNRVFCIGAGVTVNVNSAKALNSVVGHEVAHTFEGTAQYDALVAAMKEFAAESGIDWDAKVQEAKERYKNVKNADPEKELLADLVGEYLFTDSGFVKSLSTKNPGLFKRIYEEIKYLAKTFAGTKQGAALEKVKKTFAEMYRDANIKNTAQTDGVKYKIYSRPNFTKEEWAIVNRRKHSEFDNPKFDLDENQKWMYANEKGNTVFAVYSKADPDDPTVLYGSSGNQAEADYLRLNRFFEEEKSYAAHSRTTFDRILNDIKSTKRGSGNGISSLGQRRTTDRDVLIPVGESGGNGRGDFADGAETRRESEIIEENEEASDNSGASSLITFSNDYATIRNYLKEENNVTASTEDSDFDFPHPESASETKNPTADGGVKYALSSNARADVHQVLTDKNYAGEVKLTDTSPSIMLSQKDVKNYPMLMNASHIRENVFTEAEARALGLRVNPNINYHGLGEDLFLKVIEDLDDVKQAYRGTKNADDPARRENYFLLISQQTDKDGNTINVPVFINEKGSYNRVFIDTNKIATVFGRSGLQDYINTQIAKGNLVRIKNRNIQASESTSPIKADYGMDVPSDNSIRNPDEKVNGKFSLSEIKDAAPAGEYRIMGEDIALAPTREDIAQMEQERIATAQNAPRNDVEELGAPTHEDIARMEREQNATAVMDEESTAVNTNPALHTPEEQAIIEEYQNAVDEELVDYIETVKANPGAKNGRFTLKNVSDRAAADIKKLTGVNVVGNKTQLEGRIVEHILKRHGENGKADRSMRDVNDIARIQYVLDNYDNAEYSGKSKGYVTVDENGRSRLADTVTFSKKVNGTYYVVEAVPDTKSKTVFIASARMAKNGQKTTQQSLNPVVQKPPAENVQDANENTAVVSGTIVPTNTVSQNLDDVKYSVGEPVVEELGAPTSEDIARAEAMRMEAEKELHGPWRMTDALDQKVEKLFRMMLREEVSEQDYMAQLVKADRQYQQRGGRVEEALERVREAYSKEATATPEIEKKVERLTRKVLHEGIMGRMKDALAEKKPRFVLNRGACFLSIPITHNAFP